MSDDPEILTVGQILTGPRYDSLLGHGTSGAIDLPSRLVILTLSDFRPADAQAFYGPARMRISAAKTFLMVSPIFTSFSFDIVWTPSTALRSGEPALPQPDPTEHMVLNFVLTDGTMIVRGIRSSSISPGCSLAMWRAQQKLLRKSPTQDESTREMAKTFERYPNGFADGFFHESCAFGD